MQAFVSKVHLDPPLLLISPDNYTYNGSLSLLKGLASFFLFSCSCSYLKGRLAAGILNFDTCGLNAIRIYQLET